LILISIKSNKKNLHHKSNVQTTQKLKDDLG